MKRTTLGGERLGTGKKMKVDLNSYERSNHDLGYTWKSTIAPGTIVPFMSKIALPGDTWDINLGGDALTLPTVGPLFGSYKFQVDLFTVPLKNYQAQLHNNKVGIGRKMQNIKLPQLRLEANSVGAQTEIDNAQINPSCIFSYLGIRGLGTLKDPENPVRIVRRDVNAIPYLGYFDIYKNFYANKQEEIGAIIHNDLQDINTVFNEVKWTGITILGEPETELILNDSTNESTADTQFRIWATSHILISTGGLQDFDIDRVEIYIGNSDKGTGAWYRATEIMINWDFNYSEQTITGRNLVDGWTLNNPITGYTGGIYQFYKTVGDVEQLEPKIETFPLEQIDNMREIILERVRDHSPFIISRDMSDGFDVGVYLKPLERIRNVGNTQIRKSSMRSAQEGLLLKTYQSDMFNNWINTEWIDGADGINEITALSTTGESITINEINMMNKVHKMLMRIAVGDGTYDTWKETVWDIEQPISDEIPMYRGGLSKEIVFQEVISNAEAQGQPLGTLAGRGVMSSKHKGGQVTIKIKDEPCYIMGMVSLTPRIAYSQGNDFDINLKSMDDLHKPQLDEIGFQDLITDKMAWWDTKILASTSGTPTEPTFNTAGKQPAWLDYMTSVDVIRGNFAEQNDSMFMVLNRRYEVNTEGTIKIKDLTTYIDPSKYNHIFADTRRDAQNFWVQLGIQAQVRRVMSAKIMPNL